MMWLNDSYLFGDCLYVFSLSFEMSGCFYFLSDLQSEAKQKRTGSEMMMK